MATASERADISHDSEATHRSSPPPSPQPPPGDAQAVANQALALDATPPGDINLFSSLFSNGAEGIYPSGSPMAPADGPVLSEAQIRDDLTTYLNRQFNNNSAQVNEALALFDSAELKVKLAEPSLRAAFVGLKGTVLESMMQAFLNGGFAEARFGPLPNAANVATTSGPNGNRTVVFNNIYVSEDFRALIPTMGHELLHSDTSNPNAEEVIAHGVTAMTYLQILLKTPELAYSGTQLARFNNTDAIIFLNSTENDSPNSELFSPSGTGIAPGSPFNVPDLWTLYGGSGSSPASDAFNQVLANLELPSATDFNQATAESFENLNDNWMSDVERAQVSVLLQILTPQEIADAAGISDQQAIDVLDLQPYLDAAHKQREPHR